MASIVDITECVYQFVRFCSPSIRIETWRSDNFHIIRRHRQITHKVILIRLDHGHESMCQASYHQGATSSFSSRENFFKINELVWSVTFNVGKIWRQASNTRTSHQNISFDNLQNVLRSQYRPSWWFLHLQQFYDPMHLDCTTTATITWADWRCFAACSGEPSPSRLTVDLAQRVVAWLACDSAANCSSQNVVNGSW